MIYKTVSSREIIARFENDFNVDYAGWIGRTPQWIADCLADIEIFADLMPIQHCYQVVDYKLRLPCDFEVLDAVKYRGERLDRSDIINHKSSCDMNEIAKIQDNKFNKHTYELDSNNWLLFDFPEGEVTLYFRAYPFEYDQVSKISFPLVPDNQKLKMAIEWYIIKMILSRGHLHSVYSLETRNEVINPYYQYEKMKKEARNSMGTMDKDGRAIISKIMREFLSNKYYRFNEIFDNSGVLNTTSTNVTGSI
jgi:hypothetical protein